jgi:hypothetical protein
MENLIQRPAPPRITKAEALARVVSERGIAHGSLTALARLTGAMRQQVNQWDGDIPELYARRLKDVRPAWFETQAA